MNEFLLTHEPVARLAAFAGVLAAMALWEAAAPIRTRGYSRLARWWTNLAISASGVLLVRLTLPIAAVGAAEWAARENFGLLNRIDAPPTLALLVSLVVLDLLIYAQHVVFHLIPTLWRLHKVHHADPDFDTTTAIRFHPVEILLSMLIKMAAVVLIGVPAVAVVIFEIVLNAMAMFNHANISLGPKIDPILRLAIVTPDMHRVHHSVYRDEHDTNFGFNLSIWDRIFGTYRAAPRDGQKAMRIGLAAHPGSAPTRFLWSLALPFVGAARAPSPSGAPPEETAR